MMKIIEYSIKTAEVISQRVLLMSRVHINSFIYRFLWIYFSQISLALDLCRSL